MTHTFPRTTGALLCAFERRFRLPATFLENQVSDPLSHAMIVGHVISTRPCLHKLRHGLSLRFGHQNHEGVSAATLIVQRLHGLSVVRRVLEVTSKPLLKRLRRPVRQKIQGKTVKHFACVSVGPHAQPMLTRLTSRVRVDDVTHGACPLGILG